MSLSAYYPYGEPTVEPKGQRFLFGGKEREHAGGRNAYDFGARSLTPFGSWPSPDPKAEDFYQISPFSYCAGDPINFIDPTGEKRYFVNMMGELIEPNNLEGELPADVLTNFEADQIVIIDKGQIVASTEMFDKGTINKVIKNNTISVDNGLVSFTSFKIKGDNAAFKIFEFLADNITTINNIEYSIFSVGKEGENGISFVSTSHTPAEECGCIFLYDSQLKYGYTVRSFYHSHRDSLSPGRGDGKTKTKILQEHSRRNPQQPPIKFGIYLSSSQYEKESYRLF